MNNQERALPAHPYNARLQSGIILDGQQVTIHHLGQAVTSGILLAPVAPWQFWYELQFVSLFPDVSHWWFYSGWTQQARVRSLQQSGTAINGFMQFISEENPAQAWFFDQGAISIPYPPGEEVSGNFPLRLALAQLVHGAMRNRIIEDQWYAVTSLVAAGEMERALPTRWNQEWWLEGMYDKNNMRASWCAALGIRPG